MVVGVFAFLAMVPPGVLNAPARRLLFVTVKCDIDVAFARSLTMRASADALVQFIQSRLGAGHFGGVGLGYLQHLYAQCVAPALQLCRSEERRVGKECSTWRRRRPS